MGPSGITVSFILDPDVLRLTTTILFSPVNAEELFNLRHAMARNVIERIFGVLKRRFRILVCPPEVDMVWQARLPAALAAIHNFIRDHDPLDIEADDGLFDPDPGAHTGELADGLPRAAERERANNRRDDIARQMWAQYQAYLDQETV
jgi:hypothetical protein